MFYCFSLLMKPCCPCFFWGGVFLEGFLFFFFLFFFLRFDFSHFFILVVVGISNPNSLHHIVKTHSFSRLFIFSFIHFLFHSFSRSYSTSVFVSLYTRIDHFFSLYQQNDSLPSSLISFPAISNNWASSVHLSSSYMSPYSCCLMALCFPVGDGSGNKLDEMNSIHRFPTSFLVSMLFHGSNFFINKFHEELWFSFVSFF